MSDIRFAPLCLGAIVVLSLLTGCGPPDPHAEDVVELRVGRTDLMRRELRDVAFAVGGEVLGESRVDQCYEGQRNYKVDTGYSDRCSLLIGSLVGFDGDFRATMAELDTELAGLGWESFDGEWPGQLVDGYWDLRAGESGDGSVRLDRLPGPLGLYRDDLRLLFDYGSAHDERGLDRIDRSQEVTLWCCGLPGYEDEELIDLTQVDAGRHEHLVLITVEGHYWER